jgi:hypothetical protein
MSTVHFSGLIVQPLTLRLEEWVADGKLSEEDLERVLGPDACALLDHGMARSDWTPLEVVEPLVALLAMQLGGETGLVDWACEIVRDWRDHQAVQDLVARGQALVDGPGFVTTQFAEMLMRGCRWQYEGGADHFSVRLLDVGPATLELKTLIGALLARLVGSAMEGKLDVRFAGVDEPELVVFAERGGRAPAGPPMDPAREGRLHRAALVPIRSTS